MSSKIIALCNFFELFKYYARTYTFFNPQNNHTKHRWHNDQGYTECSAGPLSSLDVLDFFLRGGRERKRVHTQTSKQCNFSIVTFSNNFQANHFYFKYN